MANYIFPLFEVAATKPFGDVQQVAIYGGHANYGHGGKKSFAIRDAVSEVCGLLLGRFRREDNQPRERASRRI